MILDLDDDRCLDVEQAGGKAAWLARGRRAGLPVLPGVVVTAEVSRVAMDIGAATLETRGSGGARLEVSATPLPDAARAELRARTGPLGEPVVVRSSSVVEADGRWSGAFTSYLDVRSEELEKAVSGCWASVFAVPTLDRLRAERLTPTDVAPAVLVQPRIEARHGGVARLMADGAVTVDAVKGHPAPLVQGWEPGVRILVRPDGTIDGTPPTGLDEPALRTLAALLRRASDTTGAVSCEWATEGDRMWLLQLTPGVPQPAATPREVDPALTDPVAVRLARAARRFPGRLGEELILPWAAALDDPPDPAAVGPGADPADALIEATDLCRAMVAHVWSQPARKAQREAAHTLGRLRGENPSPALARLASLRRPDAEMATRTVGLLHAVLDGLQHAGAVADRHAGWQISADEALRTLTGTAPTRRLERSGLDRWDPFTTAVTVANGRPTPVRPATPGLAAGRACYVADGAGAAAFRPRDVVIAPQPTPHVAPLLWDAAALITCGGSPGAHLFDSARALGIPAVCGFRPETLSEHAVPAVAVAVDGESGTVYVTDW